jgi:hypothetical protein
MRLIKHDGPCCFLERETKSAEISNDHRLGGHFRQRVFAEQPSAFVLDVRFRSPDSAKIRTMGVGQFSLKDAVWNLTNEQTKERTAQALQMLY